MTIYNWATTAGAWNTAIDWNPAGVPGMADTVIFDTAVTTPYVVNAGPQSADIVNGISIVSNDVTLSGAIETQTLTIEDGGTLALEYGDSGTVIYAGSLTIGPGGGYLDIQAGGYFEDNLAVIDATSGAPARVALANSLWVNLTGITVTGHAAELSMVYGTLTMGPQGLLVSDGATFVQEGTVVGSVMLDGGTLAGGGVPLTLVGVDNAIVDAAPLGPIMDGTLAGGFTSYGPIVVLAGPGGFTGGVTIATGTLDLDAAGAAGTGAIAFAPNAAATLRIEPGATPNNLIDGYAPGDTIDLPWLSDTGSLAPTVTETASTITVALGTTIEARLTLGGTLSDVALALGNDGSGGTEITLPLTYQATGLSGSWTTPGVWNPSGVPGTGEFAAVAAQGMYAISVDGIQTVAGLTLDNPAADLVVNSDGTLVTSLGVDVEAGTLTVNGKLLAGSLTVDNSEVVINGNLTTPNFNALYPNTIPAFFITGGTVIANGFADINLDPLSAAPIVLDTEAAQYPDLIANMVQPGYVIADGDGISLSGTTSTVLIEGGTVADGLSASFVTFAPGTNAQLTMSYETSSSTVGATPSEAATVLGGTGQDTVAAYGGSLAIYGGAGPLTFIGFASSTVTSIHESPDYYTYPSVPYVAEVIGGAGAVDAIGATGTLFGTIATAGTNIFFGGSGGGNILVSGDGLSSLVGGGSGDQLYADGTASVLLIAGPGAETLCGIGSSGGNLFYGGPGNDVIAAGAGFDTVLAGTGNQTIYGGNTDPTAIFSGGGQDLIVTGAAADYIAAGSGAALVFAGSHDIFAAVNGQAGGVLSIVGFAVGSDVLQLQGYGANAVANALASAVVGGGSTILTLSDATRMVLYGVTHLTAASFI